MKPIYVTEIVREGYDAQAGDPTVTIWQPATWHRRVGNPYAVRDALTSLEARAFELGVWLAYWKHARPSSAYLEGKKFFVSVRVADRPVLLKITVPRDRKKRLTLES